MAARVDTDFRCPRCGEVKPREGFYRAKGRTYEISHYCRTCHSELTGAQLKAKRRARGLRKGGRPPVVHPGDRYGRLTVVAAVGSSPAQGRLILCVCECGEVTIVGTGNLRSGRSRSCGCGRRGGTAKGRPAEGLGLAHTIA